MIYGEADETPQAFDDDVVIVHLAPAQQGAKVFDVEFYSASKVLSPEIVGKAPVAALPRVPLYIPVLADDASAGPALAATRLMEALRAPSDPTPEEIRSFAAAFPEGSQDRRYAFAEPTDAKRMVISRNNSGVVATSGGGLAEYLWLYEWATGDIGLNQLVNQVLTAASESVDIHEQERASSSPEPPDKLAVNTYALMKGVASQGASKMITGHLGPLVPKTPENRWSPDYWKTPHHGEYLAMLGHQALEGKGRKARTHKPFESEKH